jgi:putative N6-adenine-specific DNA methylase
VLSCRPECFNEIALKPTARIDLVNGALECEFRRYELFTGKYNEHRAQQRRSE